MGSVGILKFGKEIQVRGVLTVYFHSVIAWIYVLNHNGSVESIYPHLSCFWIFSRNRLAAAHALPGDTCVLSLLSWFFLNRRRLSVARQATPLVLSIFWFVRSFVIFVLLELILYVCINVLKEEKLWWIEYCAELVWIGIPYGVGVYGVLK